MASKKKPAIKISHEDLRDATISNSQRFIDHCLQDKSYEPLFVELLEQEWRIHLLSAPTSKYKNDVSSLRERAVGLRETLREKLGEDEFRRTYDHFWKNSFYNLNGHNIPKFDDEGHPILKNQGERK